MSTNPSRGRRLLFIALAAVLALAVLEAAATAMLLVHDLLFEAQPVVAERHHSAYDPELGWVALPDLDLPDFFAPGAGVTTDSRGFRGGQEIEAEVAPGRVRILCTGDSFTFGYGVAGEEAWPGRLAALDERIEAVNLGMSGYGLGQIYLWYRRAGLPLAHRVHVLAFITDDLERLRRIEAFGYPKPRLRDRRGRLEVENVPVPAAAIRFPWLARNSHLLRRVGLLRVAGRLGRALRPASGLEAETPAAEGERVAALILDQLAALRETRGITPVLMHLPVAVELEAGAPAAAWMHRLAAERAIPFVDGVAAARGLPPERRRALYGRPGYERDPAMASHLSAEGHRLAARLLHDRLAVLGLLEPDAGGE